MPTQNPRNPFPAWRLPKGMIKASDDELEKSIESCERWEWFGGGLVFFGVTTAVAIAAIHPRYDSFLEQWGSAIADGLVAAGVAIEIKFGQMAGLRQNELKRRSDIIVAEANTRAAEANQKAQDAILELAWLREKGAETADAVLATAHATKANALAAQFLLQLTRQLAGVPMTGFLSVEQHNRIISKVKPFAGKKFDQDFDITKVDLERAALAGALGAALETAGWVKVFRSQSSDASVRGVIIEVDASKSHELLDAAVTLASALNAEGIAATVNQKTETDVTNVIHILIGPKP